MQCKNHVEELWGKFFLVRMKYFHVVFLHVYWIQQRQLASAQSLKYSRLSVVYNWFSVSMSINGNTIFFIDVSIGTNHDCCEFSCTIYTFCICAEKTESLIFMPLEHLCMSPFAIASFIKHIFNMSIEIEMNAQTKLLYQSRTHTNVRTKCMHNFKCAHFGKCTYLFIQFVAEAATTTILLLLLMILISFLRFLCVFRYVLCVYAQFIHVVHVTQF